MGQNLFKITQENKYVDWGLWFLGSLWTFPYPLLPLNLLLIFYEINLKPKNTHFFYPKFFVFFIHSIFNFKLLKNESGNQMIFFDIWYLKGLYKIFREYTLYRSLLVFEIPRGQKWPFWAPISIHFGKSYVKFKGFESWSLRYQVRLW